MFICLAITSTYKNGTINLISYIIAGVYPYSYMTDNSKYEEGLPPISAFYNDLNEAPCSPEDYAHVQKLWNVCGLKTLGDLTELYCMTDVMLLCQVFQRHRELTLRDFGLDPLHYFSAPGIFNSMIDCIRS